jgi:hypothetical protein
VTRANPHWREDVWVSRVWESLQLPLILLWPGKDSHWRKALHVSTVGKPSAATHPSGTMWGRTQERSPRNVSTAEKPSPATHPFENMGGHTVERNPMNVRNVAKPSDTPHPCEPMWGHTLVRSPMCVSSVGKPSAVPFTSGDMSKHTVVPNSRSVGSVRGPTASLCPSAYTGRRTWGRDPTHVSSVGRPSATLSISKNTWDQMLEESPMSAPGVGKPTVAPHPCRCTSDHTLRRGPMSASSVGKPLGTSHPWEHTPEHILERSPERMGGPGLEPWVHSSSTGAQGCSLPKSFAGNEEKHTAQKLIHGENGGKLLGRMLHSFCVRNLRTRENLCHWDCPLFLFLSWCWGGAQGFTESRQALNLWAAPRTMVSSKCSAFLGVPSDLISGLCFWYKCLVNIWFCTLSDILCIFCYLRV